MKRTLAQVLIENSKTVRHVDGEIGNPKYDNIGTPNNHKAGKTSREVDGKRGLGDRPAAKSTPQVQPPKSRERRSMAEDADIDVAYILKNEVVTTDELTGNPVMKFTLLDGSGRSVGEKNMTATEARAFLDTTGAQVISAAQYYGMRQRARQSGQPVPMGETLGDNPDSKASMPFSKAKNKDEGMPTPAVAKADGVARNARVGTMGGPKDNPANPGTVRKLPDSYRGGVSAPVTKVKEGIDALARLLGRDITVRRDMLEGYPDNFSSSAFDSYMGTDADDEAYDEAMHNMETEIRYFLDNEGGDYIADWKAHDDIGILQGMVDQVMDVASEAVSTEGYEFEPDRKKVKAMLAEFMTNHGVSEGDQQEALIDYLGEMGSGCATASGSIASSAGAMGKPRKRSQLFAGEDLDERATSTAFLTYAREIEAAKTLADFRDKKFSGRTLIDYIANDRRLANHEVQELQRMYDKRRERMTQSGGGKPAISVFGRRPQAVGEDDGQEGGSRMFKLYADEIAKATRLSDFKFLGNSGSLDDIIKGDARLTPEEKTGLLGIYQKKRDELTRSGVQRASVKMGKMLVGEDEPQIDHIPQTVEQYLARLNPYMEKTYGLDWEAAAGDIEPIERAIKQGATPEEFADWFASKYDLEKVSGGWMETKESALYGMWSRK